MIRELVQVQYFAICADEAADSSSKEQLPLVVRFVDDTCTIREEFLEFIVCDEGVSGVALSKKILETVCGYGLDPSYIRWQGYDGAGNMAGKCRCAAACVQREYPKAVYVHCTSHTSNLCVVAACVFFSFPKRQLELEKQMEAMNIQIQIGKK